MKRLCVISSVLLFLFQVAGFAQQGNQLADEINLSRRISLTLNGATLKQALSEITRKTSAVFFYDPNKLPTDKLIFAQVDSEPLRDALSSIFDQVDVKWVVVNRNLIALAPKNTDPPEGSGRISGSVRDAATGSPLPGANVLLKGTSLGASTSLNGNFQISNIPVGVYTIRVTYIGYRTRRLEVQVRPGVKTVEDIKLVPVGVKGKTVVVTAQATGQNEAINQQLASHNIVNVVSAARIQQLPDANAAESIGRLPGVFLVRGYGEGSMVAIRGLQPKYNRIEIDGVSMPANQTGNRAVDMSMISSDMLSGIELYKTVTPDMNAAVLGGTVNFQIREAQPTPNGAPKIELLAQGGYDHLQNSLGDYKFSGTIEKRFFHNRFGILAQALVQRLNLTGDTYGASFNLQKPTNYSNPGQMIATSLNLQYQPTTKKLYDGTLVLDYHWGNGKVDLMNFLSSGVQQTETYSQSYGITSSTIGYGARYYPQTLNVIANVLDFKQRLLSFDVNVKLAHLYTDNVEPGYWSIGFSQYQAGLGNIPLTANPTSIAQEAGQHVDLNNAFMGGLSTASSFTYQRNLRGGIDIKRDFNISNFITGSLQFGGSYKVTYRAYNYSDGGGSIYGGGINAARSHVIAAFPWMAQTPWNLNPNGTDRFPIGMFLEPSLTFGDFLNGQYKMYGSPTNIGLLSQVLNTVISYQKTQPWISGTVYAPDEYGNIASNYSGNEYENAAYVMTTLNIGPQLTLIPGVRYQGLETAYKGTVILAAYQNNTYPSPFPHTDTTVSLYHGYWLPDVNLSYKPLSWLNLRLAYTNTLTYPDFSAIAPRIDVFISTVDWNNFLLKPAHSENFDFALSAYDNTVGLFTVDPFYKRITDLIFPTGAVSITNPADYPGLPNYTQGYMLNGTNVNNPRPVNLWGVEVDWQTHFWYLPGPLTGLVFSINYTHIFSKVQYPFIITRITGYPPTQAFIDTFYTDKLIDQPSDIVNLTIGYDYEGFSARVSMINQRSVYSGTNFWPQLRSYTAAYVRWDLLVSQKLPWPGLEAYFQANNLNGEPDISLVQGTGFPTSEQSYGMTANLGLRWTL